MNFLGLINQNIQRKEIAELFITKMRVWIGGYKCQLSVKISAICQLSVKF